MRFLSSVARRRAAALLAVAALAVAAAPTTAAPTDSTLKTVVLVRHAEKDTMMKVGPDMTLSVTGLIRARELARVLGDIRFSRILVTHWKRSRQTAEPVAAQNRNSFSVIDDLAQTITAVRSEPWGSATLVVGHSNTLPQIARALTGRPFADSSDVRHDALYVVTMARDGGASIVKLRFGEPAPATR